MARRSARQFLRTTLTLAAAAALALPTLLAVSAAAPATEASAATKRLPASVPSTKTPHINDGATYAITQVGGKVIVGGTFTSVSQGGTTYTRNRILAFDASTGKLDTGFDPSATDDVNALVPGPNDHTVYVGGNFTNIAGGNASHVALLDTDTGAKVSGFSPATTNGAVVSMVLAKGHLILGGSFGTADGAAHAGFAALNPTTGALDPYVNLQVAGHHNYTGAPGQAQSPVGVNSMAVNDSHLVAVGNFKTVNGLARDQIVRLNLGSTSATVDTGWQSNIYTPTCSSGAFDTYVRSIAYSPDGSYFVAASTGGPHGTTTWCDAVVRFNDSQSGSGLTPAWTDYTGGDTLWSTAVTDTAVFVGGHNRWMNNPRGSDRAQPGSVPRPGLSALDPQNGVPFSWNPGRQPRGVSAKALLVTDDGLYVGQDTNTFGNRKYDTGKLGFFSYDGGITVPAEDTGSLPGDVYLGKSDGTLERRGFSGTAVTGSSTVTGSGVNWASARGAFSVTGQLYYGFDDGASTDGGVTKGGDLFSVQQDGTSFGTPAVVDPYNDPVWSNVQTGSGQTYRGVRPGLYPSFRTTSSTSVSGMFYAGGKVFYTQTGRSGLYSRPFSPQSGIMNDLESTVSTSGLSWSATTGMFYAGGKLYYGNASKLFSVAFNPASGTSGTPVQVSGPGKDSYVWNSKAMWLAPSTPQNNPPDASFTKSCTNLACTFDASGSSDDQGITSYDWDWGDATAHGSGKTPSHTFGTGGTYMVKLTVTDGGGLTDSTTVAVTVTDGGTTTQISYVGMDHENGAGKTQSASPVAATQTGDGLVLFVSCACSAVPALGGDLTGWTVVGNQTVNGMASAVYAKAAESGDSGRSVSVTYASALKSDMALVTYDGTAGTPVPTSAFATDGGTTSHTTPTIAAGSGRWAMSYWADKSSGTTSWTAPSGVTTRDAKYGSGSGYVSSLVADSGGTVSGSYGGLTATTDASSGRAVEWTVALAPSP